MANRKHRNILVFPGGTENGLEIHRSLCYAKEVTLFSVSSAVLNHAEYVFENHRVISDIYQTACLSELNQIILEDKIDYIYPANSLVIDFLIKNRENLGCPVLQPPSDIVNLIRSKRKTYEHFEADLRTPKLYDHPDDIENYPVFLKPDKLYGSQGARIIHGPSDFAAEGFDKTEFLISEYLPGPEYTIDCFSQRGEVIYSMARERERIRMGTTMHTSPAPENIQSLTSRMAAIISGKLKLNGLWFFQVKKDEQGELCLLEVESRVAGTMSLSRAMGVNLPLANLFLTAGIDVDLQPQSYTLTLDRSLTTRYKTNIEFSTLYIDLDDTIVVKDRLNLEAIKFLYQCRENNKRIVLLSKSAHPEPNVYLNELNISHLFNEVHWLEEHQSKADFISESSAIFVDDSFSQRREVEERHHIPCFDSGMFDVLLDERKS